MRHGTEEVNKRALWHPHCLKEFFEITRPAQAVRDRDKGVCAKCGLNTLKIWNELKRIRRQEGWAALELAQSRLPFRMDLTRRPWEADHIRPVWESRGELDYFRLHNLQTLCIACHKEKSKLDSCAARQHRYAKKCSDGPRSDL